MNEKNDLLNQLSQQLGVTDSTLKTDNPEAILNSLDGDKAAQVRDILGNPEKMKKILESPQAKKLSELLGN
jgi:hypothetical protein